ncbi:MAG TPA: carboxypeptidase-like regulatory domain-containing protein, partial [Bryobacteraceae bacterium]|nr:carboxypeptidase-like regulatory domain-containing protein [Bryobacteraceae bacterium]
MPKNPFKALPGSKKLNSPVSMCPLNKAEIDVEVYWYDPRVGMHPRHPLEGVNLTVAGPSKTKPATTPASGKWRYQPLTPGPYTVTATFPPDLDERYDVTGVAPITKTLGAAQTRTVVFLVPATWVEFIVHDTAARPLPNLSWTLERRPAAGGNFARYDSGVTPADGKVLRLGVRTGRHRFTIRQLSNPQWPGPEAVIGETAALTTDVSGYEAGEAGVFQIIDALNPGTVLDTA